jgi:penicillin-binding protein 1A
MDNLDKVRARQKAKSEKTERKASSSKKSNSAPQRSASPRPQSEAGAQTDTYPRRTVGPASSQNKGKAKKRRRRHSKYDTLFTVLKIAFLVFIALSIAIGIWVYSIIDFSFGDDLSSMNLNISSKVYYTDSTGAAVKYAQFDAKENRIWISIDKMPKNLQNAFVAIEDQRFYKHNGVDLKRTTGAVLNYVTKGDSTYGGSTITQQLVKNITNDKDRSASRKVREILRALVLETKLSKEQILEMYMNTIYLSQGANGVEAASNIYFSKSASELTLAECACIAGITQYPSRYDPILQPESNKQKRILVLDKMLELDFITKKEYDKAVKENIVINEGSLKKSRFQSYFLDHLFEEIQSDLEDKGYTKDFAANMIYNGGLKIYSTVDPKVQEAMEDVYEDSSSFPRLGGETQPQSAMVISDPVTGEIKGIVGGRGEKDRNRGLNRATQSKRQPGSSIKPIAVYAPALDKGVITQSSIVDDSPLDIDGWRPKNSGDNFRGFVDVGTAVSWSYNIPAVRVLEELGVDNSFDYMKNKLGVNSLVTSREKNGKVFSDKNLSSLALGGLTDGVTVLEMNGAYCALANGGMYIEPHSYTKVYDVEGKLLLTNEPKKTRAFKESTSYLMTNLLKGVVRNGTGTGAQISGIETCGKTGTTDDNKDRWFIGYTPYYVGSVWFGYDSPRAIYAGGNPALTIWKKVMDKVHKELPKKNFECPDTVEELTVCRRTGCAPSKDCIRVTQYADVERASKKCTSDHEYIGTEPYMEWEEDEEGEEGEENTEGEEGENSESSEDNSSGTSANGTTENHTSTGAQNMTETNNAA